jgi:hypothetical protein
MEEIMNKRLILLTYIFAAGILLNNCFAKILIIVDQGYYNASTSKIAQYANDVKLFDGKNVEIKPWTISGTNNVLQCQGLWYFLESKFSEGKNNRDPLEGAVLIGNIPVPQTIVGSAFEPFDYYYMDIWDSRTDNCYQNHDMTPFSYDPDNPNFFAKHYNLLDCDGKLDIWVSRVYGVYLGANKHVRSSAPGGNPKTILNEYGIYNEYLDRLHTRYCDPALVPYRGFAMGGTLDVPNTLQFELGLQNLNLPMYVEFNSGLSSNTGEASPFNWMSQLQVGPIGGSSCGAYNGIIFQNERNVRNSQYTQLKDARTSDPYNSRTYSNLDNKGWEWAGVYAHSSPYSNSFNAGLNDPPYNGAFSSGTLGPFWGSSLRRKGGYKPLPGKPQNSEGYYYYYPCNGIAKDKEAQFRYKIPKDGSYSIYLYYTDNTKNCSNAQIALFEVATTSAGQPNGPHLQNISYPFSMRKHDKRDGTTQWEQVFSGNISLHANNMSILIITANEQNGDVIADAIRYKCSAVSIDDRIDNVEPITNPSGTGGSAIFSTPGFFTSDCVNRSFISMQDEDGTNHNKFSKVPFFVTNACYINDYIYINNSMDNLGNLYALAHNGLTCLGTSDLNFQYRKYDAYTNALNSGLDFGQAFLAQANVYFSDRFYPDGLYILLGAGTLRAKPYIQYGSEKEENKIISTTVTKNSTNPVLIRGVTVSSGGNYTVTSKVVTSPPQQCSNTAIVIRGETSFKNGSIVDIKANY